MVLQSPHFRRHPSEGWGPASAAGQRDASLRWHDGKMGLWHHSGRREKAAGYDEHSIMILWSTHFRRHPSEGWGPASAARKRDASLRWHDGKMGLWHHSGQREKAAGYDEHSIMILWSTPLGRHPSPPLRRHPSEGWGPALCQHARQAKRDASLRWHDGKMGLWQTSFFSDGRTQHASFPHA
ncbi:hypothetical protein [Aestuariivirga sp.]|uniref:hypothetical protein n=1 Tax=Aestuariivirga sp. TaxID=2650926 RepID=UPI003BA86239